MSQGRLDTDYEKDVVITDNYTASASDDFILGIIATAKAVTLPDPSAMFGDNRYKRVGNDSSSSNTLTIQAAVGDIVGLSALLPGQIVDVFAKTGQWTVIGGVAADGTDTTLVSTADSKAVSSGVRASVADSKAVSDSIVTSTAQSGVASNSLNISTAGSQNTSQSVLISVATSTANSG